MTPEQFVGRLLRLAAPLGTVPIYGTTEWQALERSDPRRFASVARAAECWRLDGRPEAVAARLKAELREQNDLAVWRWRQVSYDLAGALDWGDLAEVVTPLAELKRRRGEAS